MGTCAHHQSAGQMVSGSLTAFVHHEVPPQHTPQTPSAGHGTLLGVRVPRGGGVLCWDRQPQHWQGGPWMLRHAANPVETCPGGVRQLWAVHSALQRW